MLTIHDMDEGSDMNDSMQASPSEFDIGLGDSHLCNPGWQWLYGEAQQGPRLYVYVDSDGGLDEDRLIAGDRSSSSMSYKHHVFEQKPRCL